MGRFETRASSYRPPSVSQINYPTSWRCESVGSSGTAPPGHRGMNGNWRGTSNYGRKPTGY